MKFQVIFTFDSEYQGYVASVPELPGCVSQGKTLDEAIGNIKDAIKGYLHVDVYQIFPGEKLSIFLKNLVMY